MNQQDLEEFAHFLRMSEMANNGNGGNYKAAAKKSSFWSTYEAKAGFSAVIFGTAIVLFRNFGHTLA